MRAGSPGSAAAGPWPWRRVPWPGTLLPGLVVIGLVSLARLGGAFQGLEWKTLDTFLRWRPALPPDPRLLIVGIDEADIQALGTYPIPDGVLAQLVETLAQYQPRAIGIDIFRDLPVEPGQAALQQTLAAYPSVLGIEKITEPLVLPPPTLPPERVGFIGFPLDADGFVRRAYLGAAPAGEHPNGNGFRLSFPLRLALAYLEPEGLRLENGRRDPGAMAFGTVELARVRPDSGGYRGLEISGIQLLLSGRSGPTPFARVSLADVLTGRVGPDQVRDRLVLIGVTSPSAKDYVNSAAVASPNPGLVYGVDMHAHVVSQLLSTVLDGRPPLRVWAEGWEYLWIIGWGLVGLGLVRALTRPLDYLLGLGLAGLMLTGLSLGLLWLGGWWLPLVPSLVAFGINGLVLPGLYVYDQTLRSRLEERQRVIEQTYDAIHGGPLQTLALLLRQQDSLPPAAGQQLQDLNQELRAIYHSLMLQALPEDNLLRLGNGQVVDLRGPLHEVLCQVYSYTLKREFPGFCTLKATIVRFEPMVAEDLSSDLRQGVCRFLEEALCNVGKHTVEATRLTIRCLATDRDNLIQVEDNGKPALLAGYTASGGRGTQQAEALAQRLQGRFQRLPLASGTRCELRWPIQRLASRGTLGWRTRD